MTRHKLLDEIGASLRAANKRERKPHRKPIAETAKEKKVTLYLGKAARRALWEKRIETRRPISAIVEELILNHI